MNRTLSRIGLSIVALFLILFDSAAAQTSATLTAQRTVDLDETDLSVLEAVAKDCSRVRDWSKLTTMTCAIVIDQSDTTRTEWRGEKKIIADPKADDALKRLDQATMARNRSPFRVAREYRLGHAKIVGDGFIEGLKASGALASFEAGVFEYEHAWLPGYNKERTEALVYMYSCENPPAGATDLRCRGAVVRLKSVGGVWKVVAALGGWIT